MTFSCNGTISKWTFVARSRIDGGRNQYPQFQLWRPSGTGRSDGTRIYRRVSESSITSTMSNQSDFTVEEYMPDDPVPFEAGDIFGLYQPENGKRRLSVMHVDVPENYGYDHYHRDSGMSLTEFDTRGSETGNNFPLIAVNTSENQQILSSL